MGKRQISRRAETGLQFDFLVGIAELVVDGSTCGIKRSRQFVIGQPPAPRPQTPVKLIEQLLRYFSLGKFVELYIANPPPTFVEQELIAVHVLSAYNRFLEVWNLCVDRFPHPFVG